MGSNNGKPVLRDDDVEAIMKTSGMSEDQVRRDFKIFVKQYPTGEVSLNVFFILDLGQLCTHLHKNEMIFIYCPFRRHETNSFQADGLQNAAHR